MAAGSPEVALFAMILVSPDVVAVMVLDSPEVVLVAHDAGLT